MILINYRDYFFSPAIRKHLKKIYSFIVASLIFIVLPLSCTTFSEQRGKYKVRFTWFLSYHSGNTLTRFLHPENPQLSLSKGDKLTVCFENVHANTYLYLFHFEPDGTFHCIYPEDFFISLFKEIQKITFDWMITDPPGTEKLYIIGSGKRLDHIEDLVTGIEKKDNGNNYKSDVHLLYEQVEALVLKTNSLTMPAEKIVKFSGVYRDKEDFWKIDVKTETLYVKKIRITH